MYSRPLLHRWSPRPTFLGKIGVVEKSDTFPAGNFPSREQRRRILLLRGGTRVFLDTARVFYTTPHTPRRRRSPVWAPSRLFPAPPPSPKAVTWVFNSFCPHSYLPPRLLGSWPSSFHRFTRGRQACLAACRCDRRGPDARAIRSSRTRDRGLAVA